MTDTPPTPPDPPPALPDRYEPVRPLGQGGFGVVWLCRDRRREREVALKALRRPLTDEEELARFQEEFQVMAGLRHPHLVDVVDYGLLPDGRPYFTMEVVEGENLARAPAMPPREAGRTMLAVLQALDHLHRHGVLHGDVKPANVLIGPGMVKLTDLGLASPEEGGRPGVRGTMGYVAPELLLRHPADRRADLYGAGVTLLHMLIGRKPFQGATLREVLRLQLAGPVLPDSLAGELRSDGLEPEPVLELLGRLVSPSPGRRPSDAGAAAAELARAFGLPVPEGGPHPGWIAPPLIERAEPLRELRGSVSSGTRLTVVTAPVGGGRTRLLQEAQAALQVDGYDPLLLSGRRRAGPDASLAGLGRRLLEMARERRVSLGRTEPALRYLVEGRVDPVSPPPEPVHRLPWIWEALGDVLERLGSPTPTLLLDDAEQAEPSLFGFLRHYAGRAGRGPGLVAALLSGPPADGEEGIPDLPEDRTVHLAPLSETGARAYLAAALSLPPDREELRPALELTGGSPGLLEELSRLLSLQPRRDHMPDELPGSERMAARRLAALPAEHRRLLQLLTLSHGPLPFGFLRSLLGWEAGPLYRTLREMVRWGMLVREITGAYRPTGGPIPAAAIRALEPGEIHGIHRGYVEVLAADGEERADLAALLHHLPGAGRYEPAVRAALQLAERREGDGDLDGALDLCRRARGLTLALPADRADRYHLRLAMLEGGLLAALGRPAMAQRRMEAALERAEERGEERDRIFPLGNLAVLEAGAGRLDRAREHYRTAIELAGGEPALQAQLLVNLSSGLLQDGDAEGAEKAAGEAIELARRAGAPPIEAMALYNRGASLRALGREEPGAESVELSLELAREGPWRDILARGRLEQAVSLAERGLVRDALVRAGSALSAARRTGSVELTALCRAHLSLILVRAGRVVAAEAQADRALDALGERGGPGSRALALAARGMARAWQGRLEEAREDLARARRQAPPRRDPSLAVRVRVLQAALHRLTARPEQARRALQAAARLLRDRRRARLEEALAGERARLDRRPRPGPASGWTDPDLAAELEARRSLARDDWGEAYRIAGAAAAAAEERGALLASLRLELLAARAAVSAGGSLLEAAEVRARRVGRKAERRGLRLLQQQAALIAPPDRADPAGTALKVPVEPRTGEDPVALRLRAIAELARRLREENARLREERALLKAELAALRDREEPL